MAGSISNTWLQRFRFLAKVRGITISGSRSGSSSTRAMPLPASADFRSTASTSNCGALGLKNSVTPTSIYTPASGFSSSSALYKHKKSIRYDPNYVKPSKAKKDKKVKISGLKSTSWMTEQESKEDDEDMTKMSSAELEERHAAMPDEEALIQAFTVKSKNRSGASTADADVSLKNLANKYPKLKNLDGTEFVKYMEFMTMYGFLPEQAVQMVLHYPPLFSNYDKLVNMGMLTWRSLGYTEKAILAMFHYYPELLEQPSLEARTRFAFLASFFSREETMFAILNCVNVLYDHESILKKKLEYLIMSNCHTTRNIVRSMALSYSLKHMRIRHEFLVRAGLFQQDNYYAQHKKLYMIHPRLPRNKYFTPHEIICTNDEVYLRICTDNMLSLNELAAFEELYEKELERNSLLMSDDEEDEDEVWQQHEGDSDNDDEGNEAENILAPAHGANNSAAFFSKKDASEFYY